MKLDLACGNRKLEGWYGVDISPEVKPDRVFDLMDPRSWPWASESVAEARCYHFFEHLTPPQRHHVMNELWRVLIPGGTCEFVTPLGHFRQLQDPDHKWPPVVPGTFFYYSREWLETNKLLHYRDLHGIRCDFALDACEMMLMADQFKGFTNEQRDWAMRCDPDAQTDLRVVVRKVGAR
jgi:predicted SAM-dependent methyltransferase